MEIFENGEKKEEGSNEVDKGGRWKITRASWELAISQGVEVTRLGDAPSLPAMMYAGGRGR